MKMDKEVRRSFERKNLERAAKKAAVVGLTTLVLSTSGIQANAASRYDNSNYRGIGYISKVEEVSELGNGGYISTGAGDYGGVSYGIYQFSTTTGSARDFINWTKKNDQEVYKYFKAEGNPRPSTAAFNRAWKKAYKELGTKFEKSQYNFASEYLIKPAYNRVKKRFGLDLKKSRAREEYLISTAVQFGPGGICNLFKEVENRGIKLDDNMDDSELLSIMCNHKRDTVAYHFRSSSSAVKAAARQRFIREKKELLKISKEESGKTLDEMKETKTNTTKVSSSKETNDTSTEEFDDVIAVDDKDIEKDYDKVEKELDEIKDTISNETQDNTESKDEEDKSTTEDEDTSKEETTDEETSKDESTKEDKSEEDNTESEDKETDTKEETKDEDKQESTENGSSLDNTLFVGDSHMKGAESTIKNNYDNSQVKATVGASAYVYLHDTKFFGEKLINSLPEDSDDIHQVVVSLGVNNITGATNESDVIKVLEKLQAKYPGKPIRFMLVNHVGNKYTEASVSKTNKLIDNLNKTISNYAKEHENVSVIDASEGLETNGKLTSTNDGLHVNNNKKLLNNIEKGVEEKQDKTTLEEAPDQVKTTDEFDSIVDEDTTKDIEEPDKATEEDNDKQESSKEDKQESTEKETTDEDKVEEKDNTEKEDKESDSKEESKDKSTESEKESSKEETTTEDNTVEEDNDKETSKDESTKEDKSEEEKDYDTKEESSVKEDKQESASEETKDNTEKESSKEDNTVEEDKESDSKEESTKEDKTEDKSEEKAVEEKQETSKEETPVKENKSTESEKESTKEDKVEEKDNTVKETKDETPAKEDKQESTEKESSKDESVKENKVEEKAVEQKQESSKEKEQPVQEEKTTEKQETKTEDNSKQEDSSTEQSSGTLNELQSRLSNNLFGKLMS